MEKLNIKKVLIHLLCWVTLIFFEVIVVAIHNQRFSSFLFYLLFYTLNCCLFYFHALVTMRWIHGPKRNIWIFSLSLFLELAVYLLCSIFFTYILSPSGNVARHLNQIYFADVFIRGGWFIAYGTGYSYFRAYLQEQNAKAKKAIEHAEVQAQLVAAEKAYLRAQLNPHILFNTFSFVKYAVKKNPAQAVEAVQELSDIISYALDSGKRDYVPICMETEQIKKILKLNQLRFESRLNTTLDLDIKDKEAPVIPLLLLTLVENVFKHGEVLDPAQTSLIEIKVTEDRISFRSENAVSPIPLDHSSGSGIKNIRERLEKYYPQKHAFRYWSENNVFSVFLEIYRF
ncbi:sensor histidine kinase [Pedobacter sp.]|uniref:sensor histidine kinase n=1 Tax=Pedobacter sp. TaxID=1411316 RepID=UPI003BAD01BD